MTKINYPELNMSAFKMIYSQRKLKVYDQTPVSYPVIKKLVPIDDYSDEALYGLFDEPTDDSGAMAIYEMIKFENYVVKDENDNYYLAYVGNDLPAYSPSYEELEMLGLD